MLRKLKAPDSKLHNLEKPFFFTNYVYYLINSGTMHITYVKSQLIYILPKIEIR